MISSYTTSVYRLNQRTDRLRIKNALRGLKSGLWGLIFTLDLLILSLILWSLVDGGRFAIDLLYLLLT